MPGTPAIASLAGPILRTQSDARLVALTREGHDRAFEEIVRRYRTPLVRFAGSIAPAASAEDVVQESLVKAHAGIAGGTGELAVRPWLYTIVRNRALNARRDERIHEQLDPEYDGVPQPPDVAARRAQVAATVAAIGALPEQQRDAIVKHEFEDLSHAQIAADMGVSRGAVRQLIFRARTSLRDGLGSLVPLPAVRALLETDAVRVGGTAGAGAGAVAATTGGGAGIALKAGVALVVAGLAVGTGVTVHDRSGGEDHVAIAAPGPGGGKLHAREAAASSGEQDSSGENRASDSESGDDSGRSGDDDSRGGSGESGSSGPGGGDDGGQSGPGSGGGDGADDGHSGGDDGHSGPSGSGGDGVSGGGDDAGHSGDGGGGTSGGGGDDGGSSGEGSGGDDLVTDPIDGGSGEEPSGDAEHTGEGDVIDPPVD